MNSSISKNAFTLIEVMVAVLIISIVIMALIQMYANNTHTFMSITKQTKSNQYTSFLIANDNYNQDRRNARLYDLVDDFDMQDYLRRELKNIKVDVIYSELNSVDLSKSMDGTLDGEVSSDMVLEFGKSILKFDNSSSFLLRFSRP